MVKSHISMIIGVWIVRTVGRQVQATTPCSLMLSMTLSRPLDNDTPASHVALVRLDCSLKVGEL